tara:strand:- start:30 stop:314 length:285 start_codon:yes stop_codon:yes gene_type:complete
MGLIEQKMHQVYKIPLYRETDLNRLRWLGGLCIILGVIIRSGEMSEMYDFASTIIGMTCLMVVSYFEKDTIYLSIFFTTLVILTAGLIRILINT